VRWHAESCKDPVRQCGCRSAETVGSTGKMTQCCRQQIQYLQPEGEDDLKRKQLMELAIINGTYRPTTMRNTGKWLCVQQHMQIVISATPRLRRILFPTPTSSPSNMCWSSPPAGYPIGTNMHQSTMNASSSSAGYYSNSSYSPSGYTYVTTPNSYVPPPPPPYYVNGAGAQLFCNK
jgi:protein quaking